MSVFFGTDGLRGVVNQDITYDIAFKCGNSLSQLLNNGGKVLIGRDTRITGSYLVSGIAAGLMAGGVNVLDVGIIPTAGVAFLTKILKYNYGIVITASHNPKEYNGIKIFSYVGEKLQDDEEEKIERGFIKTKFVKAEEVGKYKINTKISNLYLDYLICTATCRLDGLKIVIDSSNGASYKIAPLVFKRLGAKVYTINAKDKGENINFNCGSLYPQKLAKKVLNLKADMGFAFDGDADRVIAVNELGNIVNGDMIITALAKSFKKNNELVSDVVVGTSMTNVGIELELKKNGIKLLRADVGDKYVSEILRKHNLILGGEQSGHVIIKKFMRTGDGILTAIQLACASVKSKQSLSELTYVKLFPQTNIDVKVKEKLRILGSETLANAISNASQELAGLGRVLVRASGTEPKIRIMVESENVSVSTSLAKYLEGVIRKLEQSEDLCVE